MTPWHGHVKEQRFAKIPSEPWGWWHVSGQSISLSPPCSVCRESSQGKTHLRRSESLYLCQAALNFSLDFLAAFLENILIFFPTQDLPYIFVLRNMGVSRYHSSSGAAPPILLCLIRAPAPQSSPDPGGMRDLHPCSLPSPHSLSLMLVVLMEVSFQTAPCPQVQMLRTPSSWMGTVREVLCPKQGGVGFDIEKKAREDFVTAQHAAKGGQSGPHEAFFIQFHAPGPWLH